MASFFDIFTDFPPAPENEFNDEEDDENLEDFEESRKYWEAQKLLLEVLHCWLSLTSYYNFLEWIWSVFFTGILVGLIQGTLYRSTSLESKIRNLTKEAIKEIKMCGNLNFCTCRKPVGNGCLNCLMREVSGKLREAGFNSAICMTKWRKSIDVPSGNDSVQIFIFIISFLIVVIRYNNKLV